MGVLLICDCGPADCYKTTPPIIVNGKPAAPPGWTMMVMKDGTLRVGCCDLHTDIIRKGRGRNDARAGTAATVLRNRASA